MNLKKINLDIWIDILLLVGLAAVGIGLWGLFGIWWSLIGTGVAILLFTMIALMRLTEPTRTK